MEVHRQRCQACESLDAHNLLVREAGEPPTVFVRCAQCGALVARYVLSDYYHHGRGVDSSLRSMETRTLEGEASASGRRLTPESREIEAGALAGYVRAVSHLQDLGKEP